MTAETASFAHVLAGLSAGDQEAARLLHRRYVDALIRLAARRLGRDLGPRADPESVAQSAFLSFFVRQRRGEYDLRNWAMVFGLLAHITFRKCLNRARDLGRAKRTPAGGLVAFEEWQKAAAAPGPDDAAAVAELLAAALAGFDADDRAMIDGVLTGEPTAAVAARVGLSTRSVQRAVEEFRRRLTALLTD